MKFFGNKGEDYHSCPMKDYCLGAKLLLAFLAIVLWPLSKLLFRWSFDGIDELKAKDGKGRVIVMNHVSFLEPVIVVLTLYFRGQHVRPIYKSDIDTTGPLGWIITRVGGIPIRRGTADMRALRAASSALKIGECVLIYPEGTRVKSDDAPRKIHGGFALIAQMAAADVVPAAIAGACDIFPEGAHIFRPVRVWLRAGKAIHVGTIERKERKERLAQIEKESMDAVFALRDQLREEHPGRL